MKSTTLLTLFMLAAPAFAQSTIKDALVKHWKTSGEFTTAVAEAMPADGYNSRPNPDEMSFGQLMAHIAVANNNACALASGMERPQSPQAVAAFLKDNKVEIDKPTATAFVKSSFDFCNRAVEGITMEKLDAMVKSGQRQMTGFEWLWSYFTHTAHHRGQAEVYLRVKGIKPPTYVF
jgi:uncharacterized damage-inducible protein DinB